MNTGTTDLSTAYWQGLFHPLIAAEPDPSLQKEIQEMLQDRAKLFPNGSLVLFMLGWHTMLSHMGGIAKIQSNSVDYHIDINDKKATTYKDAGQKAETKSGKRRPYLHDLHDTVRGLIADFGLEVAKAPRAPKRVDNDVHYYLWTEKVKKNRLNILEETLKEGLEAFCCDTVKEVKVVWQGISNIPFKIVVTLKG